MPDRHVQVGDVVWYWPEPVGGPHAAWVTRLMAEPPPVRHLPATEVQRLANRIYCYVGHPTDDRRNRTVGPVPYSASREPGTWSWPEER